MAEVVAAIGVVGSVASIAAEGFKLYRTLDTFVENVKGADNDVKCIANDVKDTAVVLNQLENNLRLEEEAMSTWLLILAFSLETH